jgi:predicted O-linked N-acetylglucosamine transferase (SPINDLY family)
MNPEQTIEQHLGTLRADPRDAVAHARLGVAYQQAGRFEEAVASQRRALELDPGLGWLHAVHAAALRALGRDGEALASYRRALEAGDAGIELYDGLCAVLLRLGQAGEAAAQARRAAALWPQRIEFAFHEAAAEHALQHYPEVEQSLRRALVLAPGHAAALADLAGTLYRLRRFDEAVAAYREAIALDPARVENHLGLAQALGETGQTDAAIAACRQALELAPGHARALRDLGTWLHRSGRVDAALECFHQSRAADPDDPATHASIAFSQLDKGRWEEALHSYRQALELEPGSAEAFSRYLLCLSHCCNDGAALFAEHRRFGERWEAPLRALPPQHANGRDPHRRLRVGFVSADLYNHAVASFIEPVLEHLAGSEQVSLHVYYNNVVEDHVSARLRGYVDGWREVAALTDDELERQVRADGIDILFDLSGHAPRNRLPLFARKPAPVQVSWIGYAGTTGLAAMDYYLADRFFLPEGRFDDQFTEQIVRLPLCAPFRPEPDAPPVGPLPALANGHLTFGSFHRPGKLNRQVIALWSRLLHAVPDAKLLLGGLTPGSETVLLEWFAEQGIDSARLLLRERTGMADYLAQYHRVDICLSPFPYSGTTTMGDALWMGVPTLATTGATAPGQGSVPLLAHLGLDAFVAPGDDAFVELGVLLSHNLAHLADLRAGMRERFMHSLLGHPHVAAAGVERALRLMWQRWCAGLPAAPLEVRLADLVEDAGAGGSVA